MKSEYQLSKHRFYELKHFCLQYPEWEQRYSELDGWMTEAGVNEGDTTSRDGIRRADLKTRMEMVEAAARLCGEYERDIFGMVIFGNQPEHSDFGFWQEYRHFFWELSRIRN